MPKTNKDFLLRRPRRNVGGRSSDLPRSVGTLSVKSLKNSLPLMIAVFLLSIFAGIILSIIIRQWLISNMKIIKQTQAKEESQHLDLLLDKFSTF